MGQDFVLSSPRRREILGTGSKMSESCFEWDARAIVYLIAVPNPEPCQPASTRSQSPSYAIEQTEKVACESTCRHSRKRMKFSDPGARKSITFLALPREIHQLIFDRLEYIDDAVCLGLCNRYLWQIGRKELYKYYASFLAPWAGHNVVCVGDYVEPGDFPPGLFSAEEEEELRHTMVTYPDSDPGDEASSQFTLSYLAHYDIAQKTTFSCKGEFYRILHDCRGRDDPAFSAVFDSMMMTDSVFYSTQDTWVLRNLTTQEFIRADTIALEPEFIHGPFIDGIGFGQVLLSRINWSSSDSTTLENLGQIHRGVWAGHRFDIATISRHEQQIKHSEWKDVGKDIMLEVAAIWQEIEGSDWRKIITERARKIQGSHNPRTVFPEW